MTLSLKEKILNFLYYHFVRPMRLRSALVYVNKLPGKTILDVEYCDAMGRDKFLRKDFIYFGIDPEPLTRIPDMPLQSIEDFESTLKFDVVLAFEVIEHTKDPVLAIKKIKKLAKQYICVSVPYEPLYTLFRFFVPVRDHYWAVSPAILRYYFGEPIIEKRLHFGRTYFAIFKARD